MIGTLSSRLASRWVAEPAAPPWRELHGSAVLADLTGFTSLTERLTGTGAEGPEVLHRAVSSCFGAVLGAPLELGGDVLGFAGDAALVWFGADDFPDHARRASAAALRMPRDLSLLPASMMGGRRLRASVGVHTGTFHAVLVGGSRKSLVMCGPSISRLAQLEASASPAQVLASSETAAHLPVAAVAASTEGAALLRATWRSPIPSVLSRQTTDGARGSALLVNPTVRQLVESGGIADDFRAVSVAFIALSGIDQLIADEGIGAAFETIDATARLVERVCVEEAVEWLDVDVGHDAVKFIVASGVPKAVVHDDERLVRAVRAIIDASAHPLRAGAQRGRVFAGLLGVPSRRSYTVLGDPVNVAARAMSRAALGECIVGDGLGVENNLAFDVTSIGPQQLKNRALLMPMWRVTAVGERQTKPRAEPANVDSMGRHREAALLADEWKRVIDARSGRSIALLGEPGMGASSLLRAATDTAIGFATLIVADDSFRAVPFSGVRSVVAAVRSLEPMGGYAGGSDGTWEWLGMFVDRLPAHLRRWAPEALAAAEQRAQTDRTPQAVAQRTHVVLAGLLRAAAPTPWLLAIDDVDLMDDASRAVVSLLALNAADSALLLLTSRAPSSEASVEDLTLHLAPLDDEAAFELVAEMAPALRDDTIGRIVRAAAGNPFVLCELAAHPVDGDLPDSLQRVGAWLIDALPAETRRLVRDASILGPVFEIGTAAELLGRPELADLSAWRGAQRVLHAAGDHTVRFSHDAYRRVAYESLPFRRRRELHGALADLLRARADAPDAALGLHLEKAGRYSEAFPVTLRAARAAMASGAIAESVDLLGRAASMAHSLDRAGLGPILVDEGQARFWLGDIEGANQCYSRAARRLADPAHIAHLCHLRADLALTKGQLKATEQWARRGLVLTAASPDEYVAARCRLTLDVAACRDAAGDHRSSLRLAEEALHLAQEAGLMLEEGLAHHQLEMTYSVMVDERAFGHGRRACQLFEELGEDRYLNSALNNSGLTAMYYGRFDEAMSLYQRAAEAAERCGHALHLIMSLSNIGFLLYRQGKLVDADAVARRALRSAEAARLHSSIGYARILRSMVAAAEHRFDDAAVLLAGARESFTAANMDALVIDCDVTAVAHLVDEARYEEAVEAAERLTARLVHAEPELLITLGRTLGRAEWELGVGDGAARVRAALADARRLHLNYEEYRCLATLRDIAERGGPAVEPDEVEVLRRLVDQMGIVVP